MSGRRPLIIRRAQDADAEPLAACISAAYGAALARGVSLPPVAEGIDADIRDHLVWVAEDSGTRGGIRGGLVLGLADGLRDGLQDGRHDAGAHLINIAVDPSFGGRGIGKQLIETAVAAARAAGARRIDLATHVDMPENVALYTHLGWRETGRSGNKVLMSRELV